MSEIQFTAAGWLNDAKLFVFLGEAVIVVGIITGIAVNDTGIWVVLGMIMTVALIVIIAIAPHIPQMEYKAMIEERKINRERIFQEHHVLHDSVYGNRVRDETIMTLGKNAINNIMDNGFPCDIEHDEVIGYTAGKSKYDAVMLLKSKEYGFMYVLENKKRVRWNDGVDTAYLDESRVKSLLVDTTDIVSAISEYKIKFVTDREITINDIIGINDISLTPDMITGIIMDKAKA